MEPTRITGKVNAPKPPTNGKGRGPEKGRDLSKWEAGYDAIRWGKGSPSDPIGPDFTPEELAEARRLAAT